ncbi:MAG: hypothetical protein AAF355_02005 [Myxococcota bacterium]
MTSHTDLDCDAILALRCFAIDLRQQRISAFLGGRWCADALNHDPVVPDDVFSR